MIDTEWNDYAEAMRKMFSPHSSIFSMFVPSDRMLFIGRWRHLLEACFMAHHAAVSHCISLRDPVIQHVHRPCKVTIHAVDHRSRMEGWHCDCASTGTIVLGDIHLCAHEFSTLRTIVKDLPIKTFDTLDDLQKASEEACRIALSRAR